MDNDNITLSFAKGSNSNSPKYYDTGGNAARLYGGNTMTVSSKAGNITNVVFITTSTDHTIDNESKVDPGSLSGKGTTEITWTGNASSFTLTQGGTSGHCRITKLTITYADGGASSDETMATPAIEPNGGAVEADSKILINCDTEGASIVYKWNDGEEVNTGENIVEIDAQTGTLSVWAVKDGMNNSSVVTANFTIKGDTPATMLNWILDGTHNEDSSTAIVLGLTNDSAKGVWIASGISADQYVNKAYGGVQIGKKGQPFTGTFDLSDSDIPAKAIIKTAKMNVRYASGATSYVWHLEVNGVRSTGSIVVDGTTDKTLVIENVDLKGNQIRFVSAESANGIIIKGFAIEYVVAPECPAFVEHEDKDHLIITAAEGTTIYWRTSVYQANAPARVAEDLIAGGWSANSNFETPHVLTLSKESDELKGKLVEYMAVSASGLQSEIGKFAVAEDGGVTGIEGVEAEAAEAEVEWFNMQGMRVSNPGAGLYIRRQGNKVEKVIVK